MTNFGEVRTQKALCLTETRQGRQSQEGMSHRESVTISVVSSSEELSPRERAWLEGHQGAHQGSKASRHMVSVRTQRDPGRQSLGVVDLGSG